MHFSVLDQILRLNRNNQGWFFAGVGDLKGRYLTAWYQDKTLRVSSSSDAKWYQITNSHHLIEIEE